MRILRADTEVKVVIGPFVDVMDGFTPETGVDVSTADEAEVVKHNAAGVTDISGNTWAAISSCDGWYNLTLTAGNLDTEGMLKVVVQDDSVCLPVHVDFMVMNANAYDALYAVANTDFLSTNVALRTTIASVTTPDSVFVLTAGATDDDAYNNMVITIKDVSSGDIRSRRITDYAQSTKTVTVDYDFEFTIAAGDIVTIWADTYSQTAGAAAAGEIADAVWDEANGDHLTQGTTGQRLHHSGRGRY